MKNIGWLLVLLLVGVVWFAGCDESKDKQVDKISKMSKEISKLIAEQIKTLPPEAQANLVEHFNNMPPEAKKHLIANLIPSRQGRMQMMHQQMPNRRMMQNRNPCPGMGQGCHCQGMKSRSPRRNVGIRGRPMNSPDGIGPNVEGAQAKLKQIKDRLMKIPPEKRREAFKKFAQQHPEMAEKIKRMLQNQNQPQNKPNDPNKRQGMKGQGNNPNRQHPKNMPQGQQNKRLQKRPAPETPDERDFWNKEFMDSDDF